VDSPTGSATAKQSALPCPGEAQRGRASLPALTNLGCKGSREGEPRTHRAMAKATHEHTPIFDPGASLALRRLGWAVPDNPLDQKHLDVATRRLLGRKPGWDHAGVIQDDERSAAQVSG